MLIQQTKIIFLSIICFLIVVVGGYAVYNYPFNQFIQTKQQTTPKNDCLDILSEDDLSQFASFDFSYTPTLGNNKLSQNAQNIHMECYFTTKSGPGLRVVSIIVINDELQTDYLVGKSVDESSNGFQIEQFADDAYFVTGTEKAFGESIQTLDFVFSHKGKKVRIHTPAYKSQDETIIFLRKIGQNYLNLSSK